MALSLSQNFQKEEKASGRTMSPKRRRGNRRTSSTAPSLAGTSSRDSKETGRHPTQDESAVVLLAQESPKKKWENWWVRTLWTFVMIGGFIGILLAGHLWVMALVIGIATIMYREIITIGLGPTKALNVAQPWYRSLHWFFYGVANYFLYIDTLSYYFPGSRLAWLALDSIRPLLTKHHKMISFSLYMTGFVLFVLTLKKGHYRLQFYHFGWTHVTLLFVLASSHFIINNIFEGLFWFILPASLVIMNDISAYVVGFFFGRTPLIRLSPKKTWEGFLGAFMCTMVFAWFFSGFLAQFPYVTCPVENLTTSSLSINNCSPNLIYISRQIEIPTPLPDLLRTFLPFAPWKSFALAPVQLHALVLAAFASLVAPFGGFFASGFKRAFNIKDFGDSIPGHGGLTDRFDCQVSLSFLRIYWYFFKKN
jgi:phosphatidate cytidylyltransferase